MVRTEEHPESNDAAASAVKISFILKAGEGFEARHG